MFPQEIVRKKREGGALETAEIDAFVRGLVDGSWSEGQLAALAPEDSDHPRASTRVDDCGR